jgi:hypothetical protein
MGEINDSFVAGWTQIIHLVPTRRAGPAGLESMAVASVSLVMYLAKCMP